MSWYTDTQLFLYTGQYVYRIRKEFGSQPIVNDDYEERDSLSFSKHLCLGNSKESDYDALHYNSSLFPAYTYRAINSQGLVVNFVEGEGTWSREEPNSVFYNLPGIAKYESVTILLADKQAIKDKVSELEAKISSLQDEAKSNNDLKQATDKRLSDLEAENSTLKDEAKSNNDLKQATDKKLSDLEAENSTLKDEVKRLPQSGCAGGGSSVEEPWISRPSVPSNGVCFEELDVLSFSKTTPLMITKATGASKCLEDNTTNVQANHFYRGVYPIVLVNIEELNPNREEARFDAEVWGLYENAGISYAARKTFASEMTADEHKTC